MVSITMQRSISVCDRSPQKFWFVEEVMIHSSLKALRMSSFAGVLALACGLGNLLAATPSEMQAIVTPPGSAAEVLQLVRLPVPTPAEGQVLVRIYAASVNPVDWKQRPVPADAPPRIPGRDIAGVIEKLGPGVTQFKVGDAVWGQVAPLPNANVNGAYAQFAIAPAADIAPKPKRASFAEASGLGIATVTAVRATQYAQITPGQRVLVTGAAGGVGSAAVQVAKARGAYVIGTASARHAAYLKGLGIDEHIDYAAGDWMTRIQNVDAVIDTVSGDNAAQALRTMKRGGRLVYVAGNPGVEACTTAGVECLGGPLGPMNVSPTNTPTAALAAVNAVIEEILQLADSGKLNIAIEARFPLDKAAAAQEENRNGSTQGKIVLVVDAVHADEK
jgi:NADPH:quinone reductase-like Zn-dependent oxidoreductase